MRKAERCIKKKILPGYFKDVISGVKTFELRKDEDNVQVGDILDLNEWEDGEYTGRTARCLVTYVLRNVPEFGLMDGYCIIGIKVATASLHSIQITQDKTELVNV